MKKKNLIIIGAVAAVALALFGFMFVNKNGQKTEITYMTFMGAGQEETMAQLEQEFEAQNPDIDLVVDIVPFDDYFTKLNTAIASGDAPDVYDMNIENFTTFAENGAMMDVSEITNSAEAADLDEKATEAFNYQGTQYAVPASFSNVVLFYNKDLFDAAGVEYPTSDWTWEDQVNAAKQIEENTDAAGMYAPFTYNEFYKLAAQNGGSLVDEEGNWQVNTPENIEALQYMYDKVYVDGVSPSETEMSGLASEDMFMNGEVAMIHTGIWMFPTFAEADFNWDIAVEPGNTTSATHFFTNGIAISSTTENPEAAQAVVEFFTLSPEIAQARIDNNWEIPANLTNETKDQYLAITPPASKQVVFDSLDSSTLPPTQAPNYAKVVDILSKEIENVALDKKTPEQALNDAQTAIDALE